MNIDKIVETDRHEYLHCLLLCSLLTPQMDYFSCREAHKHTKQSYFHSFRYICLHIISLVSLLFVLSLHASQTM